jgi:hypothetical protein
MVARLESGVCVCGLFCVGVGFLYVLIYILFIQCVFSAPKAHKSCVEWESTILK